MPNLPSTINSPEAERVQRFLQSIEAHPELPSEGLTLTLYGSTAVTLYHADETTSTHHTNDVDVHQDRYLTEQRLRILCSSASTGLHCQLRRADQWLIHPDWEQARCEITVLLGLAQLRVLLLSPCDLIFTKLLRYVNHYEERDIEDCYRLAQRYLIGQREAFCEVLEEAILYYPYLSEGTLMSLRLVPDDLFS